MAERASSPSIVLPHGERVASLESKFDSLIETLRLGDERRETTTRDLHALNTARFDSLDEKADKTNGRVKSLELWRNFVVGAIAVLTFELAEFAKPVIDHWLK